MLKLKEMNLTELAELAQEIDEGAHRGLGREKLEAILHGKEKAKPRHLDKVRLTIMQYILGNWKQVSPLLSCPARTQDPRACFTCTDIQVVECAVQNEDTIFGDNHAVTREHRSSK